MSKHETLRYQHMLDNARKASALMRGKTRADLKDESIEALALVRLLQVLGESNTRKSTSGTR